MKHLYLLLQRTLSLSTIRQFPDSGWPIPSLTYYSGIYLSALLLKILLIQLQICPPHQESRRSPLPRSARILIAHPRYAFLPSIQCHLYTSSNSQSSVHLSGTASAIVATLAQLSSFWQSQAATNSDTSLPTRQRKD